MGIEMQNKEYWIGVGGTVGIFMGGTILNATFLMGEMFGFACGLLTGVTALVFGIIITQKERKGNIPDCCEEEPNTKKK